MPLVGTVSCMSTPERDEAFLEAFSGWLRTLGSDVVDVSNALRRAEDSYAREVLVGSLNYLFKSIDLIPDGIEDLGMLDDTFVLRTACAMALPHDGTLSSSPVRSLAADATVIHDFLGEDDTRLEKFCAGMRDVNVRGQTAIAIAADAAKIDSLCAEVNDWARAYEVPGFSREPRNLIKLRAFLLTKLPQA